MGVDVQLIVSKEILGYLSSMPQKMKEEYGKNVDIKDNLKVFFTEKPPTVAFTVSEKFNSLGLKSKNSPIAYMGMDLNSTDPRAIKWGLDLFDYYKKQSKPVKLSDYL